MLEPRNLIQPREIEKKRIIVEVGAGAIPSSKNNHDFDFRPYPGSNEMKDVLYVTSDVRRGTYEGEESNDSHYMYADGCHLPFKNDSVSEVIFRNVLSDPHFGYVKDKIDVQKQQNKIREFLVEAQRVLLSGGIVTCIDTISRCHFYESRKDLEKIIKSYNFTIDKFDPPIIQLKKG